MQHCQQHQLHYSQVPLTVVNYRTPAVAFSHSLSIAIGNKQHVMSIDGCFLHILFILLEQQLSQYDVSLLHIWTKKMAKMKPTTEHHTHFVRLFIVRVHSFRFDAHHLLTLKLSESMIMWLTQLLTMFIEWHPACPYITVHLWCVLMRVVERPEPRNMLESAESRNPEIA